jgi:hypothetical protein
MTTNLAYALPARAPREVPEHPLHIEIVSTRSQRRARPRLVYALVAVAGLFLILVAQLLLSILLSNGAYQISGLQATHKELSRDQQTLTESLQILDSPQNLAGRAQQLGMVQNSSSQGWLRLSDGKALHDPAAAPGGSALGSDASTLIPNSLITPEILAQGTPATPTDASGAAAGAPAGGTGAPAVPSTPEALPSPVTH